MFLSGLFIGISHQKRARNLYRLYWVTPYRITQPGEYFWHCLGSFCLYIFNEFFPNCGYFFFSSIHVVYCFCEVLTCVSQTQTQPQRKGKVSDNLWEIWLERKQHRSFMFFSCSWAVNSFLGPSLILSSTYTFFTLFYFLATLEHWRYCIQLSSSIMHFRWARANYCTNNSPSARPGVHRKNEWSINYI